MYELGSHRSTIREIFEYGNQRAAIVGRENVLDFSLGNPNVPAPDAVREAILAEVRRLAQDGVDEALFHRMKRAIYGLHLRVCDVPDAYARQEVTALFSGEHYADFAALLASVTPADVQTAFRRWAQPECAAMSVVRPK